MNGRTLAVSDFDYSFTSDDGIYQLSYWTYKDVLYFEPSLKKIWASITNIESIEYGDGIVQIISALKSAVSKKVGLILEIA